QGGFTGIRVRNNAEGTALLDFLFQTHLFSVIRLQAPAFRLNRSTKVSFCFAYKLNTFACPISCGGIIVHGLHGMF
ncbi:MAG TPA: hypothetical protein VKA23_02630, partial [Mariprofundaceae bacterium]|nr:hypothetical protein [Mariprofundaceae bacterium]